MTEGNEPSSRSGVIVIRVGDMGWDMNLLDCDPHRAMVVLDAALRSMIQRHEQEHAAGSADAPTEAESAEV